MKHNEAVQAQAIANGAGPKFLEEMGFERGTPEFENELYQLRKDAGLEDEKPASQEKPATARPPHPKRLG